MSATTPPPGHGSADPRSTPELVKDIVAGTQTLVRQEVELAKLELMEGAAAAGVAAGTGGAAGVVGLYVLGFLGLAGGFGLAEVVATWLAFLIVAGIYLLLMIVLLLIARSRAKAAPAGPEKARQRIQEDIAWAKRLTRR